LSTQNEERRKLSLLGLLLFFMLILLVFTMAQTIQEVHNFQQENSAFKARDVSTIRTWMTIPVVSHIYQVPENYLYLKLHISNSAADRHATLNKIAYTTHQPVARVIKTLQYAIVQYRQEHPSSLSPSPMLSATLLAVERREA
jgi:hypothetical protein